MTPEVVNELTRLQESLGKIEDASKGIIAAKEFNDDVRKDYRAVAASLREALEELTKKTKTLQEDLAKAFVQDLTKVLNSNLTEYYAGLNAFEGKAKEIGQTAKSIAEIQQKFLQRLDETDARWKEYAQAASELSAQITSLGLKSTLESISKEQAEHTSLLGQVRQDSRGNTSQIATAIQDSKTAITTKSNALNDAITQSHTDISSKLDQQQTNTSKKLGTIQVIAIVQLLGLIALGVMLAVK